MESQRLSISFYATVGLIAGAIIAYQIAVMRVFSVGTWSHFGSLTVSMAMLGFGLMSAIMCVSTRFFERYWGTLVALALFTFGPLPDNNILESFGYDAPEGATSPSVSDGVFVMLKPLAAGQHTIHFGGTLDLSGVGGPLFVQDITYHVTVKR